MSENNYTINYPKPDKTTYYSHNSTYSIVDENGKSIVNHAPAYPINYAYSVKHDDSSTDMDKLDIQTKNVVIYFRDGESVSYNNAYDLQDFLNQVNHYHDLQEAFKVVVKKLLEVKPELDQWVDKNFQKYLKLDLDTGLFLCYMYIILNKLI